jgi:hypothetical protein
MRLHHLSILGSSGSGKPHSTCNLSKGTLSRKKVINLLNAIPIVDLQTIGVKDRIAVIISARRIIAKHNLLRLVQNKVVQMEHDIQYFKYAFEQLFSKGIPSFWDGKVSLYNQEDYHTLLM